MALTDEQKKALVERLRLARAKKAAEKKKNPDLASEAPPKKKRVPVVVDVPSVPLAPVIQAQPVPLAPDVLPEPLAHPLYARTAQAEEQGVEAQPKKTKTKFMKVVWYKEPTKKQMKALEKIAEDDVEDAEGAEGAEGTESDASDESLPPPPVLPAPVKAPAKSKPRAIPATPRAKPAPAPQVDERQEYLKRMAAMYFN